MSEEMNKEVATETYCPGMKWFIGVKRIKARPMKLGAYNGYKGWEIPPDEDPERDGYLVKYSDTYESWSPKDAFESAYLEIEGDGTTITEAVVNRFMGLVDTSKLDEKTTLVVATTLSGFKQYEVSSCVDPKNYNHKIGTEIATERIKNNLWKCMGFVLQWAKDGLKVMLLVVLALMLVGCKEAPESQVWGQGDPPAEWRAYFGNENGARLNFMQSQVLDQLVKQIDELTKLNAEQHEKMGKTDISFHGRLEVLEAIAKRLEAK